MAEDCVCTNLASIYSMQSDLFTKINSNLGLCASRLSYIQGFLSSINNTIINQTSDLVDSIDNLVSSINDFNTVVSSRLSTLNNTCNVRLQDVSSSLEVLDSRFVHDVSGVSENITEMLFNKRYQIENLDLGEVAVSNEIIVESQMWSYVGRGEVGFNDLE